MPDQSVLWIVVLRTADPRTTNIDAIIKFRTLLHTYPWQSISCALKANCNKVLRNNNSRTKNGSHRSKNFWKLKSFLLVVNFCPMKFFEPRSPFLLLELSFGLFQFFLRSKKSNGVQKSWMRVVFHPNQKPSQNSHSGS